MRKTTSFTSANRKLLGSNITDVAKWYHNRFNNLVSSPYNSDTIKFGTYLSNRSPTYGTPIFFDESSGDILANDIEDVTNWTTYTPLDIYNDSTKQYLVGIALYT